MTEDWDPVEDLASRPGRKTVQDLLNELDGNTSQWIYPGLICDSYTLLTGLPKAGKSMLAVNIAAAYSRGEPLLGVAPEHGAVPRNVLIAGTEGNLEKEYAERLRDAGADLNRVSIERVQDGRISGESYLRGANGGIELAILDNAKGFARGESINSDEAVDRLASVVEPFNEYGVPVVIIHHANRAGRSAQGNIMGNTQYAALARHIIEVKKTSNGAVRLSASGNLGDFEPFTFTFDDHCKAHRSGNAPAAAGDSRTQLKRMAELAVQAPDDLKTKTAIAKWVAEQLEKERFTGPKGRPLAPRTVSNRLGEMEKSEKSTLNWDNEQKRYLHG